LLRVAAAAVDDAVEWKTFPWEKMFLRVLSLRWENAEKIISLIGG
jgi:hypothetical protein